MIYSKTNDIFKTLHIKSATGENYRRKQIKYYQKISHLKYPDPLKACKLPTLHYRRIREDMIETYHIN